MGDRTVSLGVTRCSTGGVFSAHVNRCSHQIACSCRHCSDRRSYQLIGGRKDGLPAPVLKLQDGSTVADDILLLFQLYQQGEPDPASHYASLLRNVVIDMGDNPSTSAISMSGAQLCSIEDVAVQGQAFYGGIVGLPGSGGYTSNLIVRGGKASYAV